MSFKLSTTRVIKCKNKTHSSMAKAPPLYAFKQQRTSALHLVNTAKQKTKPTALALTVATPSVYIYKKKKRKKNHRITAHTGSFKTFRICLSCGRWVPKRSSLHNWNRSYFIKLTDHVLFAKHTLRTMGLLDFNTIPPSPQPLSTKRRRDAYR